MEKNKITGKPSIDLPHLKWYPEEAYNGELPKERTYEYMFKRNKSHLNDTVLKYFGRVITYREFFKKIDDTQKAFVNLGVKEGDIVTIMGVNSPELVYSFYALNKMNAIPNMVDPRTREEGLTHYLKETNSKYLLMLNLCYPIVKNVISKTSLEKIVVLSPNDSLPFGLKEIKGIKDYIDIRKGNLPNINYGENFISWVNFMKDGRVITDVPKTEYKENTTACIVRTGGTTGIPKGVCLTNENLNAMVDGLDYAHTDLKRHRKFLNILVPFVAYGAVNGIHTAVCKGWESTLIPQLDVAKFDELLLKEKPEIVLGIPTYFDSLKESKKMENADLKEAISYIVGGDGMKTEKEISLDSFMLKHGGRVIKKGYGLTECAACATLSSDLVNDIGSVGIPLPRNIVSAFDPETHEEKSYYELGELCITGPTVMKGYYNNQEATDDMIKVHKDDGRRWLHSGDIGYIAPDGQVYHKDRIKRMIIRSGFKVYPSEIENVISKLDYVRSCSVVGVPSEEEGMVPVTFVVLEDKYKNQNLEETIKDSILENISKSELMEYSYPAEFEFRDDLPLTPVGKIDFKKLIKEYLDEHKEVNSKIYSFNINN